MRTAECLIGRTFDQLTVTARSSNTASNHPRWNCICTCGATLVRAGYDLRRKGKSMQACSDCVAKARIVHGKSDTRVHNIWMRMIQRTTNKNCEDYTKYGYGSVGVCAEWLDFSKFLEDMGEPPSATHSLDRIDGSKGYSKENCRWATPKEQARNKSNNRVITLEGESKCLAEWCEILNLPYVRTWQKLYIENLPPEVVFAKARP